MTDHFDGGDLKTAAKLVILEEALDIYTTIMDANWDYQNWYVDTHAGTGKTRINDQGINVDGSAIIALDEYSDSFDRFYFYELNDDNFDKLVDTLSDKFGLDFDVGPARVDGESFRVARSDDPYIRIMQMDSNDGVSFLAENAAERHHWFTFVDPKGLTAKRDTLDTMIDRGNMDILLNYQTTGVMRSAAAEHAHGAVTRTMGDEDWPNAASRDEYVDVYKNKLEENQSIAPVKSKELVSPHDERVRFDLVFACTNSRVREIIEGVMHQEELWSKANDKIGQSGLGEWT